MKYDFEQIRDEIEKEFFIATVNDTIRNDPEMLASFTNQDQGIKAMKIIEQSWDGQTNQDDINKAINRISKSANKESKKESVAKRFIQTIMSNGFYGYLRLRKLIGHPLEHFTLRPYYANRLSDIPTLVNPGGQITLSEGNFVFSAACLLNKDNIWLRGLGVEATKISGTTNANTAYIKTDFSVGNLNNVRISDLYVDATGMGDQSVQYVPVIGCNSGSSTNTISHVMIDHVKVLADAQYICPIHFGHGSPFVKDLKVFNCDVKTTGTKCYGIGCWCKGTDVWIENNKVEFPNVSENQYNPIFTYYGSENVHINSNRVLNTAGHSSIALSPASNAEIIGNIVESPASVAGEECGIEVEEGNGHQSSNLLTSHNVTIIGNYVYGGNDGIAMYRWDDTYSIPHDVVIANNVIVDCTIGIRLRDADHCIVKNNILRNNTTPLSDNSTNSIISNNIGYNPVGNFTAPSMPASGVNYTNEYGYSCMVSVYGGTVSAIAIDGVNTGQTYGAFVVAPGETISLTYSSVPTWVWYGL